MLCCVLQGLGPINLYDYDIEPVEIEITIKANPFYTMVVRDYLDKPQFSLWLNPDVAALDAGELVFGGVTPARHTAPLQMATVVANSG